MSALDIEGVPVDEHKRLYPERWLRVRSSWATFRGAFIIYPVFFILNWLTGDGFKLDSVNVALIFGWLARSLVIALDPPIPHHTDHMDCKSAWVRFRAWWSK